MACEFSLLASRALLSARTQEPSECSGDLSTVLQDLGEPSEQLKEAQKAEQIAESLGMEANR